MDNVMQIYIFDFVLVAVMCTVTLLLVMIKIPKSKFKYFIIGLGVIAFGTLIHSCNHDKNYLIEDNHGKTYTLPYTCEQGILNSGSGFNPVIVYESGSPMSCKIIRD